MSVKDVSTQSNVILPLLVAFIIITALSALLFNVGLQSFGVESNFFGIWSVLIGLRLAVFSLLGK